MCMSGIVPWEADFYRPRLACLLVWPKEGHSQKKWGVSLRYFPPSCPSCFSSVVWACFYPPRIQVLSGFWIPCSLRHRVSKSFSMLLVLGCPSPHVCSIIIPTPVKRVPTLNSPQTLWVGNFCIVEPILNSYCWGYLTSQTLSFLIYKIRKIIAVYLRRLLSWAIITMVIIIIINVMVGIHYVPTSKLSIYPHYHYLWNAKAVTNYFSSYIHTLAMCL